MPPMKNMPIPPKAAIRPHEMTIHGHTRVDNYYWLNERDRGLGVFAETVTQEDEGKKFIIHFR